jgi:hypothetical protein
MRLKTIGMAVTIGLAMAAVTQALAQRDNGAGAAGKLEAGAGASTPASRPNENIPNPTNPNANDPNAKNPTATNPNVNDPNATDPTAKITGRSDASAEVRTNQPAVRTTDQDRRDEHREADRATTARTDERGNRDDIQWRYKYYNGVWWYWLPDNRWVYWSNNAWQDYNPSTVQYQYEYDRFGRPLRYRSGYRGLTGQSDHDRTGAENRTDTGRFDANRREADNTRRDTDANRTDKDANRSDRDRETSKPGDSRSENSAKPSDKSEQNKPGK